MKNFEAQSGLAAPMSSSTDRDLVPAHLRVLFTLLYLAGFRSLPESWGRKYLAAQDWLLLGYLSTLVAVTTLGSGPTRARALAWLGIDLTILIAALAMTRTSLLRGAPDVASVVYRVMVPIPALATFMQLHLILPAARHRTLDAELAALDLRIFGVEPALDWDVLVSPPRTEWFAFFYYGYFAIIAVHMIPMLFLRSDPRLLTRFSFGFLWVYCVGQALYVAVPAYGPYVFFEGRFTQPLAGSTWWPLVSHTVQLGGARTDVFPSLHTAVPTYLSIFSFLYRRRSPFRYTWLPLTMFTTQIIVATLYLRWHYVIDVVAGLTLAASAALVGEVVARREASFETWPGGRRPLELSPLAAPG